jgi:hypothetical protein
MIVLLIGAEKNMFGCEEEEIAWLGRDGEEKCGCALDARGLFGTDSDTKSSGKGLSDLESPLSKSERPFPLLSVSPSVPKRPLASRAQPHFSSLSHHLCCGVRGGGRLVHPRVREH